MKITYEITAIMRDQTVRRKCYSMYEANHAWREIVQKERFFLKTLYCRIIVNKNPFRVIHKETLWKSYFVNGKEYVCPPWDRY